MQATHTDYKHPKHLRVLDGERVLCVAPSHSQYARLNRTNLPRYKAPFQATQGVWDRAYENTKARD